MYKIVQSSCPGILGLATEIRQARKVSRAALHANRSKNSEKGVPGGNGSYDIRLCDQRDCNENGTSDLKTQET